MTVTGIAFITLAAFGTQAAMAATATVNLGTSSSYAVLAGSAITNTGPTSIGGDIGLSPGTAITGFPPGGQTSGTMNIANGAALGAENDLITASVDAAGRTPFNTVTGDLGGTTLVGGVYQSASSMALTGNVTLNGAGNPSTVWIFQAGSTLTTASASDVTLENGAQACNVFWQVGSSATLGTTTDFAGTIIATRVDHTGHQRHHHRSGPGPQRCRHHGLQHDRRIHLQRRVADDHQHGHHDHDHDRDHDHDHDRSTRHDDDVPHQVPREPQRPLPSSLGRVPDQHRRSHFPSEPRKPARAGQLVTWPPSSGRSGSPRWVSPASPER